MNKTKTKSSHEKTWFPQIAFDFGLIIKFTKHHELCKKGIVGDKHHVRNVIQFLYRLLILTLKLIAYKHEGWSARDFWNKYADNFIEPFALTRIISTSMSPAI